MSTAALLASYLDSIDGSVPFDWATNNCSHFAAGWWQAVTGADPLHGLAMPADAAAAAQWLAQRGTTLADLVAQRIARPRIDPRLAQPGDLVIVAAVGCGMGAALGVCAGRLAAVLGIDGRLIRGPMSWALHAYPLDEARA